MDNIALLVFKFYLYLSFLFLLGRSFVVIISKFTRQKVNINSTIHGLDIQIFYPIIGIFFLGNYLYILNYLLPVRYSKENTQYKEAIKNNVDYVLNCSENTIKNINNNETIKFNISNLRKLI